MPHRVFEVDEILRAIALHMGKVSQPTTVSFACCCKAFEDPALSSLWVHRSLKELLKLLPSAYTHHFDATSSRPTHDKWRRFRRYASWIQILSADATPDLTPVLNTFLNLPAEPTADISDRVPKSIDLTWSSESTFLRQTPLILNPATSGGRYQDECPTRSRFQ